MSHGGPIPPLGRDVHRSAEAQTSTDVCVLFDGDDTLWITEPLYDAARAESRRIVERVGLDGARWEEIERQLDVANVALLGHSAARFPLSCRQAYEVICTDVMLAVDPRTSAQIETAARSVFERRAEVMPGAQETLAHLRARGVRIGLLTKGDPDVQTKRIADSRLGSLFDAVAIVKTKTPETIRELIARLGACNRAVWIVGNSMRSDIVPALAAGANAVWIDSHVWEYEREHQGEIDPRVIRAERLSDLLKVVGL